MVTFVTLMCPVLLARGGLLIASDEAKVWFCRGLCCSTAAQDGEVVEEEVEEGRGRFGDEAGGPLGFSFSIMMVKSQGDTLTLLPSVSVSLRLYMYVRVTNMFM